MRSDTPAREHGEEIVLRLEEVQRIYQRGEERVAALDGVTLSFKRGTFVVVLGPSGGGKSTLLHLLGGMDRPDKGRVLARGRDIAQLRSDQMAAYRRGEVGFVFQSFHLLPGRTTLENVELPMLLAGVPPEERRRRALFLLDRVGLSDRAQHRPNQLSGGQAQRVAIARALAMNPPILLADEPTGNLDSASGQEVTRLLVSLAHDDGRTVVVVTHNPDFEPLADRVIRVRDGKVVSDESGKGAEPRAGEETPGVSGILGAGAVSGARDEPRPDGSPSLRLRTVPFPVLVGQALMSARRRLGRAVLTGLGVAIGIAAMVLLVGLGAGLETGVVSSITSLGPLTSISVSPQAVTRGGGAFGALTSGPATPINAKSLKAFSRLPGVRGVYASPTLVGTMTETTRSAEAVIEPMPPKSLTSVPGILPVLAVGHWPTGPGQMVVSQNTMQLFFGRHVHMRSVLGRRFRIQLSAVASGLFGGGSASASAGNLAVQTLRVTGVTTGMGLSYVPYTVAMGWLSRATPHGKSVTYPAATVLAGSVSQVSGIAHRIQSMGYGAQTMSGVVKQVQGTFGIIETGLGAIGAIALVVAGLMIAVVMSMAVMERKREIGVLRAVGARRRDISTLFLSEAASIGLAGGIVGVAVGAGVGFLVNAIVSKVGSGTFAKGIFSLPPWLIVLGLAFGTGIAVLAGVVPASRAASLNPVDALRDE